MSRRQPRGLRPFVTPLASLQKLPRPPRQPQRFLLVEWIEAIFDQLKDQLSLERHGAHTMPGLHARVAQRLLALAACVCTTGRSASPAAG